MGNPDNNLDAADTVQILLAQAGKRLTSASDSPRLDAEVLLMYALETSRASLYANPDQQVPQRQSLLFHSLIAARIEGRPVAQLTGEREFWSLNLKVTDQVLVPRPETERLVEIALTRITDDPDCQVLDLGTGSGAIAIALAAERPRCSITASDYHADALNVARDNAARLCDGRIRFTQGNWFNAVENERFDLIVSNPPYIAETDTAHIDASLEFEPRAALFSGADGLDDIRHIVANAPRYLKQHGSLMLEHGYDQAAAVTRLLKSAGFSGIETHHDLANIARVTTAHL